MAGVDLTRTTAFLEAETRTAASTADGHRAWVIRDALSKIDPADAERIRATLDGIRRRSGAPPTSRAAEAAERFGRGLLGGPVEEPPLT